MERIDFPKWLAKHLETAVRRHHLTETEEECVVVAFNNAKTLWEKRKAEGASASQDEIAEAIGLGIQDQPRQDLIIQAFSEVFIRFALELFTTGFSRAS